jgi:hypothetical protein
MARERKYAGLPDMVRTPTPQNSLGAPIVLTTFQEDAPDIYETPDLTDDLSTVPVRLKSVS